MSDKSNQIFAAFIRLPYWHRSFFGQNTNLNRWLSVMGLHETQDIMNDR